MQHYQGLDILILFFQDGASQPIIKGREEYIPLLRRIQSKTIFQEIFGDGHEISGLSVWKTTQKYIDQLNCMLADYKIPPITKDDIRREVDSFVNDPNQDFPSGLSHVFQNPSIPEAQQANFNELAWKCFFLITLFPAESLSIDNFLEIGGFLKQKLQEAEEARKQLLTGTIRFVTTIAQAHVDEGFAHRAICRRRYHSPSACG